MATYVMIVDVDLEIKTILMKKLSGEFKFGIIAVLIVIATWMMLGPQYNVYKQRKAGEAELAHAQAQREVAVAEAKAQYESASYMAGRDTVRAHGIARANEIIGVSLKNNREYLQYLWIEQLEKSNVIYVPTESNMPVLEAGRGVTTQRKLTSGGYDTTQLK